MKELSNPPYAPVLVESTRSIGYSLESAIADLIDNSITAESTCININFLPYDSPYISILDDGHGMSKDELISAMRYGSKNPSEVRSCNDLGRFGLGLKTASLSQCRCLTVVSFKEDVLSACQWDLDIINKKEDWILLSLEQEEILHLPHVDQLMQQNSGTLIIWQHFDRICDGEESLEKALGYKMDYVRDHLSLVFHRYLSGETGLQHLRVFINNNPVEVNDPFLLTNKATEPLPEENILIEGQTVVVKPFILPHVSKLSVEELNKAGGVDGFRRQQGFYIYRNKRLIIWGTWFHLIRQEELTKLARVRVDIPNSLDYLWTLDIKKSAVSPPDVVRRNLRRIIGRIVEGSKRVYTFRGRKINSDKIVHSWDRIQSRDNIFYRINRNHPIIETISNSLDINKDEFEMMLNTLETTLPVHALYADMAADRKVVTEEEDSANKLKQLADRLINTVDTIDGGKERLLSQLYLLEPFCRYPEITEEIIKEYEKNE